jgi:hypothetical protein
VSGYLASSDFARDLKYQTQKNHHEVVLERFEQSLKSKLVEGAGFEPAKAEPADLQSAPVDRLGTPPS